LTRTIAAARDWQPSYDVILIDSWHTHQSALEDLDGAWMLLRPGGFIVVPDCNPATEDLASPDDRAGDWCGETYRAYLDFLAFRRDVAFSTVDTANGCGVIRKLGAGTGVRDNSPERLNLWLNWLALPDDAAARYAFFVKHREALLRLIDAKTFCQRVSDAL
jgi:hypothetical protein